MQLSPQARLAHARHHSLNFLLFSPVSKLLFVGFWSQADDVQRREMLTSVGRLLQRNRRFAFHDKSIKIFSQQDRNGLRQGSNNTDFDVFNLI